MDHQTSHEPVDTDGIVVSNHAPEKKSWRPSFTANRVLIGLFVLAFSGLGTYIIAHPKAETITTLDGELLVIHADDTAHDKSYVNFKLKTKDSEYLLDTQGQEIGELSGSQIQVQGQAKHDKANTIEVPLKNNKASVKVIKPAHAEYHIESDNHDHGVSALEEKLLPKASADYFSTAPAPVSMAVVLVNFSDDTRQVTPPDKVKSYMFDATNSVKAYYYEESGHKVSFTGLAGGNGDVYGWWTLPMSRTQIDNFCHHYSPSNQYTWSEENNFRNAIVSAAQARNVNLGAYDFVQFAFPNQSCQFGGIGWIGKSQALPGATKPQGLSYINMYGSAQGTFDAGAATHELGHNFGSSHASSLTSCHNSQGQAVSNEALNRCAYTEYGDGFDIMGSGTHDSVGYHMTAYDKALVGFLTGSSIKQVTASGTYSLSAQEFSTPAPQLIEIPAGAGYSYYLEYRRPYGRYFDNFAGSSTVVNGVSVRYGPSGVTSRRYTGYNAMLLDMHPTTTLGLANSALTTGQQYVDNGTGIALQVNSVSQSAASVNVTIYRTAPLYRYWNSNNTDHYYDIGRNDAGLARLGYSYERCDAQVFLDQPPGTVRLWRYWNPSLADHYYTVDRNDAGLARLGYQFEDYFEGYVFDYNHPTFNTTALYRYWNPTTKDHYYTVERTDGPLAQLGYQYERIEAYVKPPPTDRCM